MRHASRLRSASPSLGAEALLSGLVVLCPLALGGAAGWLVWPLVALSGLAAGLACLSASRRQQRLHLPLLARGGMAAFAFSQGLRVLLLRRQSRSRGPLLAVVACLLAAAVAGGLVALEPLAAEWASAREIQAASRSKVAPWPEVALAARAYPLGMGLCGAWGRRWR